MSDTENKIAEMAIRGKKIVKYAGPGTLRPGAGKLAIKTEKAVHCGSMIGRAFGVRASANRLDPSKTTTTFFGQFLCVAHDGKEIRPAELYVPSIVEGSMAASLRDNSGIGEVTFAYDIWCEPDEVSGRKTALGYQYAVHDLIAPLATDPLKELAYQAGVFQRPDVALAAPSAVQIDPETGEILPSPGDAASGEDRSTKQKGKRAV